MADLSPPDVPDPASATSGTDRPVVAPSKIRSRPTLEKAPRLPGTYAANYGDDMNWHRGVAVLWTLFGLAALGELVHAAFYMLAGHAGWPLSYDLARVGVGALVFLTLWLGWSWTRWLLVVADFLFGMWLVIWVVAGHTASGQPPPGMEAVPGEALIETLPKLALGIIYLFTAGYLAFSADVIDFTRHRREEGRGWVFIPVLVLVTIYVALVATAQVPYWLWIALQSKRAQTFGDETMHAMTDHWNSDALAAQGDEHFLQTWTPEFRGKALGSLAPLGTLQKLNGVSTAMLPTTVDDQGGGFLVQYRYDVQRVNFSHGHAHFNLLLTKHPFGSWRLDNFEVDDVNFDTAPKPLPPAAPVPAPAAAPTTAPSPAGG